MEQALNSALLATLAGGVALTLVALAASPLVGLFFHSHQVGEIAAVMSGWLFLRMAAIVPDAILQRRFSFMRRVIVDPLSTVVFAAGAIVSAAFGLGVWALVIGTYAGAILTVVSGWAFAGWRPRPHLASWHVWRELSRFGRPVVGASLIMRLVEGVPVLAIGRFIGSTALGQFTYAMNVASRPLGAVVDVGGYVLLPAFSRLSADDVRFRAAVRRALRWICITSFPAGMLLVPLGFPAVVLVFGGQWSEAGYGTMALAGYCAALSLDSIASEAWKAYGRTDMLPRMHGLSLVLTIFWVLVLVPFGLVGVAIGLSLSAIGVGAFAVWGMAHALGIALKDLLGEIWPPALAAILMAGGLFCLEHFVVQAEHRGVILGLALLALEALVGVMAYAAVLAVLAPQSARELRNGLGHRIPSRRASVRQVK